MDSPCIFGVFSVYFPCISRVFPVYFRCTTDVKSMYTSVYTTCNIEIYRATNIYMTCVRNNDALIASYLAGVRAGFKPTNFCLRVGHPTDWATELRRTSAWESDTLPTELLWLDYLITTYTVLISCTCDEKSVVLQFTSIIHLENVGSWFDWYLGAPFLKKTPNNMRYTTNTNFTPLLHVPLWCKPRGIRSVPSVKYTPNVPVCNTNIHL